MADFNEVSELIKKNIPDAEVSIQDLTGTKDHLGIAIFSDRFEGLGLIDQHQMVMDILREKLKGEIHAVQLKTMTKHKAKEKSLL